MSDDERLDELLVQWQAEYGRGRDLSPDELCRDSPHLAERAARDIAKLKRLRLSSLSETPRRPPRRLPRRRRGRRRRPRWRRSRASVTPPSVTTPAAAWATCSWPSTRRSAARSRSSASSRTTPTSRAPAPASSARRRSPAGWSIPASCRFTAGAATPTAGPTTPCASSAARACAAPIEEFYKPESAKKDSGERAVAFRALLQRFTATCNTVAYAHSRGVIHRDLKPANIMLGPYGETLVVDWGLAKYVGRDEPHRDPAEDSVRPAPLPDGDGTPSGAAVGTPAYMSPEQAPGQAAAVGPASDVFCLGATLYEILTGRTPYRGALALVDAAAGTVPAAAPGPPRRAAGAGGGLPQGDGVPPGGALRHGAGPGAGRGPLAGGRADDRLPGAVAGAGVAPGEAPPHASGGDGRGAAGRDGAGDSAPVDIAVAAVGDGARRKGGPKGGRPLERPVAVGRGAGSAEAGRGAAARRRAAGTGQASRTGTQGRGHGRRVGGHALVGGARW